MLVLTRKENETIRVGDEIVIRVLSISKGRMKLGIQAPESLRVVRGEVGFSPLPVTVGSRECLSSAEF